MARLDVLRAIVDPSVLVIDMLLSLTSSPCAPRTPTLGEDPAAVERVARDEDVAVPCVPASSDLPVHLICVMRAMPALSTMGLA